MSVEFILFVAMVTVAILAVGALIRKVN